MADEIVGVPLVEEVVRIVSVWHVRGNEVLISFFYTMNDFSPLPSNTGPLFSVYWNNQDVLEVAQVGTQPSLTYLNGQVVVTATGSDTLVFKNGVTMPHASYLDDIAVFQIWY